jgi:hypothetical protein
LRARHPRRDTWPAQHAGLCCKAQLGGDHAGYASPSRSRRSTVPSWS